MSDDIQERLDFIGIDGSVIARLRALGPFLERSVRPALSSFYERSRRFPETRRVFRDEAHIASAEAAQVRHWGVIATGNFDAGYFKASRRIGNAHARVGLAPRWYIGGYAVVTEQLVAGQIRASWPRGIAGFRTSPEPTIANASALIKAAMLDMDIVMTEYQAVAEAEQERLQQIANSHAAEAEAVVASVGDALARLRGGDLTHRLSEPFSEAYEPLRRDLNAVIDQLQQTLSQVSVRTASARGPARSGPPPTISPAGRSRRRPAWRRPPRLWTRSCRRCAGPRKGHSRPPASSRPHAPMRNSREPWSRTPWPPWPASSIRPARSARSSV